MSENKTRARMYIYGERTENLTIAVPESKKPEILAKFYELLKEYHDPKMLSLEPKSKIDKKTYEGFPGPYQVQDEAPNLPKEVLSELFKTAKPEIDKNIIPSCDSTKEISTIEGHSVSSLPKDKKRISQGLYSGGGKFYTNKIIDNQLQILEWENRESAEEYLVNLK